MSSPSPEGTQPCEARRRNAAHRGSPGGRRQGHRYPRGMPPDAVPPEIRAMADARSEARRARDWATADGLKAELEAAGWRVIGAASLYTLERAAPPDLEVGG